PPSCTRAGTCRGFRGRGINPPLPAAAPPRAPAPAAAALRRPPRWDGWARARYNSWNPMKILIVDDDQQHGESLAELLCSRGYEAFYAPNQEEAEWLSSLFRFDLSIIDFDLRRTTGPELARDLVKEDPALEV